MTTPNTYPLATAKLKEIQAWLAYDRSIEAWLYSAENELIPADAKRTAMLLWAKNDYHARALAAAENVREVLDEERYNRQGWGAENAIEQKLDNFVGG